MKRRELEVALRAAARVAKEFDDKPKVAWGIGTTLRKAARFLSHGECENSREIANTLHGRAGAALDNDANARPGLLVLGRLAGLYVAHELLDVGHANLGDLLATEQRNDVMRETCEHPPAIALFEVF